MNIFKAIFGTNPNTLSAVDAKARIDEKKAVFVLDVRQPDEFRAGHIPGAKLIPLHELGRRINEIPKDRDILCVCRSGARSGSAMNQLNRAGYQAYNMRGGMMSWMGAGYPVKKGK